MSYRVVHLRVVIDTSVLVAGLRSQLGASNRVLVAVAERRCIPLVTTAIFLEYEKELKKVSKNTYPLKLPSSVKNAAAELAKLDGVSLNQFIAAAVAEKVRTLRTASDFLRQRARTAKPKDLLKYLRRAPKVAPTKGDERT